MFFALEEKVQVTFLFPDPDAVMLKMVERKIKTIVFSQNTPPHPQTQGHALCFRYGEKEQNQQLPVLFYCCFLFQKHNLITRGNIMKYS